MLKDVLDAFITHDAEKAMDVWHRDEAVDDLYDSAVPRARDLHPRGPAQHHRCIDLLFIAKNIERIGDHTTNIAEKIHYMVHGVQIKAAPGRQLPGRATGGELDDQ
jgi:phosphate transport system protein